MRLGKVRLGVLDLLEVGHLNEKVRRYQNIFYVSWFGFVDIAIFVSPADCVESMSVELG